MTHSYGWRTKHFSRHPEKTIFLSLFYFQVTLVTKTKIIEDDTFFEIFLDQLEKHLFWHI